jgi:hypothetical protein
MAVDDDDDDDDDTLSPLIIVFECSYCVGTYSVFNDDDDDVLIVG